MGAAVIELAHRVAAAQAAKDAFEGVRLDYRAADCIRMITHVLRELGNPPPLALKGVRYSTPAGALRAWKRTGFADLGAALDAEGLPRIPFARRLPADFVAMPADTASPWGSALAVVLDAERLLGFHASDQLGAVIVPQTRPRAVWRPSCRL